jgi:hypothetical protein
MDFRRILLPVGPCGGGLQGGAFYWDYHDLNGNSALLPALGWPHAARVDRRRGITLGVHIADWQEFEARFCSSSPRRVWLSGRLRILLEFAATGGKLRRIFVWGSFVTGKPAPGDIDILLIMDEDFETEIDSASAQAVFDSVRARLLFESDVFWARASIGDKVRAGKKC